MPTTTPFIVIGGFLGAGKTTLLQRWLGEAHGLRLAVLVNDFGAVNLDAALVAQQGARTLALTNGCVCCSLGDDLGAALPGLLAMQPPFDALVVEASGVADPWRIAQYALADPRLALAGVVVLVDAAAVRGQAADPLLASSLATPLAHADLVLLNKADRTDAAGLAAARAWVEAHAGPVPMLATTQAALPLAPWLADATAGGRAAPGDPGRPRATAAHGPLSRLLAGGRPTALAPPDHDGRFAHWTVSPHADQRYDAQRLRSWLRTLPPGVLRLKGGVRCSDGRWAWLQYAGRHGTLRRVDEPPAGTTPALVAIGLAGQLPEAALAAGLAAALAAGPAAGPAAIAEPQGLT